MDKRIPIFGIRLQRNYSVGIAKASQMPKLDCSAAVVSPPKSVTTGAAIWLHVNGAEEKRRSMMQFLQAALD